MSRVSCVSGFSACGLRVCDLGFQGLGSRAQGLFRASRVSVGDYRVKGSELYPLGRTPGSSDRLKESHATTLS